MTDALPVRLPQDLYSPEQLSAVIIELRAYTGLLRDTNVRARATHATAAAPHASALLLSAFHESGTDSIDQPGLEKLIKQFEAIRDKAPSVHLMMAALPNRDLKRTLTEWF